MSGCDLRDAFPEDTASQSGKVAAKEERRKAKRCAGPALAFLKAQETPDPLVSPGLNLDPSSYAGRENPQSYALRDPDRQNLRPLPPAEKMSRQTRDEGFVDGSVSVNGVNQVATNRQWKPVALSGCDELQRDLAASYESQKVEDVIGQKSRTVGPRATISPKELPDVSKDSFGFKVPDYFGKTSVDVDAFADFSRSLNDNPGYQLTPADFLGSFAAVGLGKASGNPVLSTPSVNDAWKPLTPGGARSSYFEALPSPGGDPIGVSSGGEYAGAAFSRDEKANLLKKLDTLFARLEELESKRNEYAHMEISMFILSGLFLMFGLETVRKMRA
jgi:hypothetical protein